VKARAAESADYFARSSSRCSRAVHQAEEAAAEAAAAAAEAAAAKVVAEASPPYHSSPPTPPSPPSPPSPTSPPLSPSPPSPPARQPRGSDHASRRVLSDITAATAAAAAGVNDVDSAAARLAVFRSCFDDAGMVHMSDGKFVDFTSYTITKLAARKAASHWRIQDPNVRLDFLKRKGEQIFELMRHTDNAQGAITALLSLFRAHSASAHWCWLVWHRLFLDVAYNTSPHIRWQTGPKNPETPGTHPSQLASEESAPTPPRDEAAQARSLNDRHILSRWGRRYRSY
jgi:hypothetical protein